MKKLLIAGMLLAGSWAQASLYLPQTFNSGGSVGTVTGGNVVGTPFTGAFNMANSGDVVLGITVTLNVSSGYSGGFYFSLVAPNGSTTVILMNQPLTDTDGMHITFSDGGLTPINSGSNLSSGTYQAVGLLSGFNGQSANGNWTLYFADTSSGESSTLTSWSLGITVVPEPVNVALGVFAGVFVLAGGRQWWKNRKARPAVQS